MTLMKHGCSLNRSISFGLATSVERDGEAATNFVDDETNLHVADEPARYDLAAVNVDEGSCLKDKFNRHGPHGGCQISWGK